MTTPYLKLLNYLLLAALAAFSFGCSSIRTDAEGSPVVGMWFGADQEKHKLACNVLCDRGLRATVDERGVVIKEDDTGKAMAILLTDERMQKSGLMVPVLAVAGSGKYTKEGFVECTVLAGEQPPEEGK